MNKVSTISYGSVKEYATVPARLKRFREENPRASITPTPTVLDDGSMIISVLIVKDKATTDSAEATGSARYSAKELEGKKAYEKLETIATGRALSLLGYLNDGEIAGSEEMEEFEDYKENKLLEAIDAVKSATSRAEIQAIQASLVPSQQAQLNAHILDRVKELQHATAK